MANINFDVAEVLDYDRTYNYIGPDQNDSNVSELFALKVRSCSSYFNNKVFIAKPSNINIKQIPLIGEFVLIYKTFNQESTSTKWREVWYYVTSIDVQSSINENMLPGISDGLTQDEIDKIRPGKNFVQKSVSPLQPYEGDFIIEGRVGNSIRFGSTVDLTGTRTHYHISPPWRGAGAQGDPIIILSNGHVNYTDKKFTVENIQQDASSLYLTSTQSFPSLKLHNDLSSKADNASSFSKSQFIGIADRIILKSKTDIIALDSNSTIELNSPLLIIGNKQDSEKEWGLHSTEVIEMFNEFFYLITLGGLKDSTGMPIVADPAFADKFLDIREKLENKKIRQDKGN